MNQNKQISVYDNTISARTYLSYISEQAGGFACIGRDGRLYIKTIGQSTVELPIKYLQKFSWGDKFKISRVRYEDGIQLFEKGSTANNTVYLSQENMYIVDQEQIDNIYAQLDELEVYGFEGDTIIDPALDIGDILIIDSKKVIYQGSSQYGGKFKASISSKIQSKLQEETTTRTPSQKVINRRVQSQIDQENLKISELIQENTEQGEKITSVEKSLEGVTTRVESTEERIETAEGNIEDANTAISNLDDKLDGEVSNLQAQIDGQIQFWNGPTIPTLSNEPALNWKTEADRNNHRADIYTVIEDIDGEMKQGKSYRFDNVGTEWTWVELTDNELSAVQALAASKAKVFTATPKVPYNVGDLWLKNKELYECAVQKDASGVYAESDWVKATKYTDDTVALLAQSTADTAISNQTITATTEEGRQHYLPHSADNNCKSVEIFGESTQETRSGINKIRFANLDKPGKNGVSITSKDGILTCSGTPTAFDYIAIVNRDIQPILPAGTYTLWLGNMQADCYYNTYNEDGSQVDNEVYFYYGKNATTLTTELPFKLVEINLYFNSGISYDGKIITPMFVSGTYNNNTIPTFERYGAMPSPEFPSKINSITSKNLFDQTAALEHQFNTDGTLQSEARYILTDGKIQISRHSDGWGRYFFSPQLLKAGTYTYSANLELINNTGVVVSYSVRDFTNMVDIKTISYIANEYGEFNFTFTIEQDTEVSLSLQPRNSSSGTLIISNLMLINGSAPKFYVPYNHIGFKSVGKNLSKNETLLLGNPVYLDNTQNNYFYIDISTLNVGDILTLSFKSSRTDNIPFYAYSNSKLTGSAIWVCTAITDGSIYKATFTINEELLNNLINTQGLLTSYVEVGRFKDTTELMVEKNTLVTEYQPYKESITTIPLLHDMRSLPNGVRDRIYYSNGKWYDEQRVNERVIKTNEGIWEGVAVRENTTRFYIRQLLMDMPQTTSNDNVICSHFPTNLGIYNNDEIGIYLNYANASYRSIYISVPKSIGATIEEIKAWFDENEVKIQYELAEPIVTEITDEATIAALESIKTFKSITNITADAPSVLTYYRDVPMVDEYETKQNANKTYKAIKSQFADLTIEQNKIKSTVSETITKVDEQGNKIGEVETSLNQVTQTAEETKSEVSKKVGNDEIISKINQSAEEVQIDANKISLKRKNVRFNI